LASIVQFWTVEELFYQVLILSVFAAGITFYLHVTTQGLCRHSVFELFEAEGHLNGISQKTKHFSDTKMNRSMLLRKYSKNHTKPINTLCGQNAELLIVKVGGTYEEVLGIT
jgi:hypothetical protein